MEMTHSRIQTTSNNLPRWLTRPIVVWGLAIVLGATALPAQSTTSVVASVLPASRSVQTNTPATLFATILNAGTKDAINCRIEADPLVAATLSYQTTDLATNAVVGVADTPVNLQVGKAQTFVIVVSAPVVVAPTELTPRFVCDNAAPATPIPGVNTFVFSASAKQVPDVIALGATPTSDGVVLLPKSVGANAFSVASINVGSAAKIRVAVEPSRAELPVTLTLCETDPITSVCINPEIPSSAPVEVSLATDASSTFGIFVAATGDVPFDPANNRAFVSFKDAAENLRGATSVALRLRTPDDPLILTADNASNTLNLPLKIADSMALALSYALGGMQGHGHRFDGNRTCAGGGTIDYGFADNDKNTGISAGDEFAMQLANCRTVPSSVASTLTGAMTLKLSKAMFWENISDIEGRLEIATPVQQRLDSKTISFTGAFDFKFRRAFDTEWLEIVSNVADFFELNDNGEIERFSEFRLDKQLNTLGHFDYVTSLVGTIRSDSANGTLSCEATELIGDPGNRPVSGTLDCSSTHGGMARLDALGQVFAQPPGSPSFALVADGQNWVGRPWDTLLQGFPAHSNWPQQVPLERNYEAIDGVVIANLDVAVVDLAASTVTGRIYALTDTGLLEFSPATGDLLGTIDLPEIASHLALADDGVTLWIAYREVPGVQSLNLQTRTLSEVYDLGLRPDTRLPLTPLDIAPVPGRSNEIVLILQSDNLFSESDGVVLLRDGAPVGELTAGDIDPRFLLFAGDTLLARTYSSGIAEFEITASGLTQGSRFNGPALFNRATRSTGGMLYSTNGRKVDWAKRIYLGTATSLRSLQLSSPVVSVNPDTRRVLNIDRENILIYDMDRLNLLGLFSSPLRGFPLSEARIGSVVAVATSTQLLLLDSAALANQTVTPCLTSDLTRYYPTRVGLQLTCRFNDIVHAPVTNQIYASVGADMGEIANSIAVITPETLEIKKTYPLPAEADKLSLSSDGATLYMTVTQGNYFLQLDLATGGVTHSPAFLEFSDNPNIVSANLLFSLNASPTIPSEVIFRTFIGGWQLVRNRVIQPSRISNDPRPPFFAFYLSTNQVVSAQLNSYWRFSVNSQGLSLLSKTPIGTLGGATTVLSNNVIYSDAGDRFDINSETLVRRYDMASENGIAIDKDAGEVVSLSSNGLNLAIFDEASGELLGKRQLSTIGRLDDSSSDRRSDKLSTAIPGHYLILRDRALLSVPHSEVPR